MNAISSYAREVDKIPRLTKPEEYALGLRALDGDHEAINSLVTHNLRLVLKIAMKYPPRGLEDRIQMGNMGLITAAESFDPRISSFSNWAYKCIESRLHNEHQSNQYKCRKINMLGDSELVPVSPDKSPEQVTHESQMKETLLSWINELPDVERAVILMYYDLDGRFDSNDTGNRGPGTKVAAQFRHSHQWVDQIKKKALARLGRRMKRHDLTLNDWL
jgi:RNA polymerase sigma factor (sigma-70 family)